MTVQPGTRLGPYEIVAAIGAGGMGEVWRARDTRLDREVAIKVLPAGFAENELSRERFEREARSISQLNHAHVCTLYDVGVESSEGRGAPLHYLVMELLEGESLADRILKGPLPLHDVLRFGRQIASALDAAHRQGITHRDLKPGNIMLTKSGAKLLDFGLAKTASESSAPLGSLTSLPTAVKPLTQQGTIIGTFQYMAPEQLEGLEADSRTDIFALGAVLYEMATGKRAFEGASRTSLIAAIVSSQPAPISSLVATTPPALDHVLRKCLEKDPDDRWQSARDVASQLLWIGEGGSQAGVAAPSVARRRRPAAWIGWAVAAAIAASWTVAALTRRSPVLPIIATEIAPPQGVVLSSSYGGIALSPDGRKLAFVAHGAGEKRRIWIRDLGSSSASPLAGTDDASLPVWSADGKSIMFRAEEDLRKVPVDGGAYETVATGRINGATWTQGGDILYANNQSVFRVPVSGGAATTLVELPNHRLTHPRALPDGRRFLFTSIRGTSEPDALYVGTLDGAPPKKVIEGVYSNTAYVSPGLILYFRDGGLRAQPVDPDTLMPRGDPFRIAAGVQYDPESKSALFSVSDGGPLVYVPGTEVARTELAWVSRSGAELGVVSPAAMHYTPRLSHDGKRVAVDISEPQTAKGDIWVLDLARATSTRLTYDQANESAPIWTPSDRSVVFFSEKRGYLDLYERSAGGIGGDEVVLQDTRAKIPLDLSPDGRWLAFQVSDTPQGKADVWLFDRQGHEAKPLLTTPFAETEFQFSPDGNWVAYVSDESGEPEVYVLQFPESPGKWIVSRGGGEQVAWSADGRQIYYLAGGKTLMSVAVTLGESFDSGPPQPLFDAPVRADLSSRQYCVSQDGSRFLLNRRVGENATRPIAFVQNWSVGLER